MTDLIGRLEAEGITLSLSLKLEASSKPSDVLLEIIRDNRDALISHLARSHDPKTYGAAFLKLMCWASHYGDLRLECPGGVTLDPQPQHIRDALEQDPWGVVYGSSEAILTLWGDVPQRITDTANSPEAEDHEVVIV